MPDVRAGNPCLGSSPVLCFGPEVAHGADACVAQVLGIGRGEIGQDAGAVDLAPLHEMAVRGLVAAEIAEVGCAFEGKVSNGDFTLLAGVGFEEEVHSFAGITGVEGDCRVSGL